MLRCFRAGLCSSLLQAFLGTNHPFYLVQRQCKSQCRNQGICQAVVSIELHQTNHMPRHVSIHPSGQKAVNIYNSKVLQMSPSFHFNFADWPSPETVNNSYVSPPMVMVPA